MPILLLFNIFCTVLKNPAGQKKIFDIFPSVFRESAAADRYRGIRKEEIIPLCQRKRGYCRTDAATPLLLSTNIEFRNSCATVIVWKSTISGWFGGVLSARKLSQWLNFSEERAGRPWKPLHFKSAAATCAVRGCERPENMPVAYFQRTAGRQALGNLIRPYRPPSPEGKALTRGKGEGVPERGF